MPPPQVPSSVSRGRSRLVTAPSFFRSTHWRKRPPWEPSSTVWAAGSRGHWGSRRQINAGAWAALTAFLGWGWRVSPGVGSQARQRRGFVSEHSPAERNTIFCDPPHTATILSHITVISVGPVPWLPTCSLCFHSAPHQSFLLTTFSLLFKHKTCYCYFPS